MNCYYCQHRRAISDVCVVDGKSAQYQCGGNSFANRIPVERIPHDYNPADYALDSRGTEGCGC